METSRSTPIPPPSSTATDDAAPCPADEIFSLPRMLVLGLQHLCVMISGTVAVPFIIGSALGLSSQEIAILVSAGLFTCGIATIIQAVGFWKFGIRLPLMQGVTFASVTPIIAIGTDPVLASAGSAAIMQAIYGAIIAAGLFALIAAPFAAYIIRLLPPLVVGSVLAVIGISLMPVAIEHVMGGYVADAGAPHYIALAFGVLMVILLINRLARGFLANIAILVGLGAGLLAATLTGMTDFSSISEASWIAVPPPFFFGAPTFHLVPILTMCLVVTITWVESAGGAILVGEIAGRPANSKGIGNLIRADGLSTLIGGVFNAFPYTAFSENIALISITGVKSRWVVGLAGLMLACLGLFPKLSALVSAIPKPVVGGAGLMMFGVLFAAGVKTLRTVDFDTDLRNFLVLGLSIGAAMIPITSPSFFQFMPDWSSVIFESSVVLGANTAIILNLLFNGISPIGEHEKVNENVHEIPSESY